LRLATGVSVRALCRTPFYSRLVPFYSAVRRRRVWGSSPASSPPPLSPSSNPPPIPSVRFSISVSVSTFLPVLLPFFLGGGATSVLDFPFHPSVLPSFRPSTPGLPFAGRVPVFALLSLSLARSRYFYFYFYFYSSINPILSYTRANPPPLASSCNLNPRR
jgi:hypothetical protein